MIPAGERNERVTFRHQPTTSLDTYGRAVGDWADLFTPPGRWAKVTSTGSAEQSQQRGQRAVATWTIELLHTPQVAEAMQVVVRGITANVTGVTHKPLEDETIVEAKAAT